jgi:hypothetical protein
MASASRCSTAFTFSIVTLILSPTQNQSCLALDQFNVSRACTGIDGAPFRKKMPVGIVKHAHRVPGGQIPHGVSKPGLNYARNRFEVLVFSLQAARANSAMQDAMPIIHTVDRIRFTSRM